MNKHNQNITISHINKRVYEDDMYLKITIV